METSYKFFYFRKSPRGNAKFGVTDVPWQRLRVQQQGTDEEIQFDHLWLIKSYFGLSGIENIETKMKQVFKEKCMADLNGRAGHTEWFSNLDFDLFRDTFDKVINESYFCQVRKIPLTTAYTATKKSQCPLDFPKSYDTSLYEKIWTKIC